MSSVKEPDSTTNSIIRFPPGFGWRNVISAGNVGVVVDLDVVMKLPLRKEDQHFIDVEKQVYERLANEHKRSGPQPLAIQARWIQQTVESIAFVHSKSVLHADICCNNFFLDENLDIKLGDFAGSSIDGSQSLVAYQISHAHPGITISIDSEIFALGSVMYEIITGEPPYKDLSHEENEDAYQHEIFPEIPQPILGLLITKCWRREYATVDELVREVEAQSSAMAL
ncbi:MAG: Peptidyl-prolyl cis-trans isomerase NIMA-interacting protein 1 [Chaenotheca gracillima]|nr:MAG: Peptidyl-prolyl cis-trans isomerase NIMA-interacting protein 1 [Chaenotheca gracillima]